ncbi:MAG TPA: hypothetical protein VGB24_09495 [Longimicrobium sp.]|jgi:hypothetical protein|uniref:hypothetical protein n=1 Tax=Longimicrobium sp. TaxID=2029185 RepID=UPI002ED82BDE
MRTVRDAQGRNWRIWHVVPQSAVLIQTSPQMGQGWLCFESDGDKRRMAQPPEHWATMTDAELLELLSGASEVKKTEREAEKTVGE